LYKLRKDLEEPPALAKLGWGSRVSGYAGFVAMRTTFDGL